MVEDATQLVLPSSIHLLDDGAPARRRFQGDDAVTNSARRVTVDAATPSARAA